MLYVVLQCGSIASIDLPIIQSPLTPDSSQNAAKSNIGPVPASRPPLLYLSCVNLMLFHMWKNNFLEWMAYLVSLLLKFIFYLNIFFYLFANQEMCLRKGNWMCMG